MRRRPTWRRPERSDQVVNARDDLIDLTPASEEPARRVRAGWAALLPGWQDPIPEED